MINVAFFGSSEYSNIILQKLITLPDFNLVTVITKPDKPTGRTQEITANPVADFARKNNLPLLQPEDFTPEFTKHFQTLNLDLALVVAYGPPYFTQELIDIPAFKIINIHPSPLPRYRGATPGPWQIIKGETKSSITFFQIDALPDHGPIITQIPLEITLTDTSESFYFKAFNLAASSLESVLKNYVNNPQNLTNQDDQQKSYFPKLNKQKAQIDWTQSSLEIYNFIRALYPWPIAWTYVENQQHQTLKMKIISADISQDKLILKDVQVEGKTIIPWSKISAYYIIIKK